MLRTSRFTALSVDEAHGDLDGEKAKWALEEMALRLGTRKQPQGSFASSQHS
jgi:hypothetical protein